jgi:hypothetical protein
MKEKLTARLLAVATPELAHGEQVIVATTANVGSVSVKRRALTAALAGIASGGLLIVSVRPRMFYIALTNHRILFFDMDSLSGRPTKLAMSIPKDLVSLSEPKRGPLGLTLVTMLTISGEEKGLKFVFPYPHRADGREFSAAFPRTP